MATGEQEQIETERKYDVDAGFVVPDLAGSGGAVRMTPPDVQHLAATYFDTDDLRLIGSHIALRRRTGGDDAGWHIKLPVGGDTRREVHFPLGQPTRTVPGEIAAEVARWSGGAPLRPVARLAETAMASVVREAMARGDDARSLLRDLFRSEADLLPELEQQIMRVHVHPMSNPRSNRAIAYLLQHLNDAEFTYPGTNLRLVYSIVGAGDSANPVATQIPPGPEV